ncbi:phosphate ABC transporter substrate-binding protein [Thalassotalea euphylliae]|uniref:Phosphate ABC transporter substrate-binding protein n=1 Tax=Thalassotalea euphylliae TaxID=1655234 RepID=A0A3E0TYX5_9GAMM|nr:phosphate ABC transporter substrate-binding protein [Thalassotalea euphylliae]REL29828.1 phosphate ABC transporter substrate-binding protein [Thalassotalea euphylliae]
MKLLKTLSLSLLLSMSTAASAEVAVIVNSANGNSLSDSDISRAFLGKLKTFADGQTINAVNSKAGNQARGEFEKLVLKKSSAQVKAYWSKRLFTGKGKPLKELASDADIISFVASTPNAIGYVDASSVDGSVKVLKRF